MSSQRYEWIPNETDLQLRTETISSRASVVRLHGEDVDWYFHAPMKDQSLDDNSPPQPQKGTWFITATFMANR